MPNTVKLLPNRRYLLLAVLFALGLYVLLPQVGDFRSSLHVLRNPKVSWVALAIVFTSFTYLAGAATYCLLAFKRLAYGQMVLVQLAAMFVNRLLPGGIGALGANFVYLGRNKHSPSQAASVVAVNNLLGFVGHSLIVFVTLMVYRGRHAAVGPENHTPGLILKYLLAGLVIGLVVAMIFGGGKLKRALAETFAQLLEYRRRPARLSLALLTSMALTLSNVLCLYACALALGAHLNFAIVLLVFTAGISAGTATPTPGGLGGFEAGLAAGFIAYHVASPTALAIALLYRLISYWLALVAGAVALVICQRRKILAI